MCQSDGGQISCAAGGDSFHHHCQLFSHFWKVCALGAKTFLVEPDYLTYKKLEDSESPQSQHIYLAERKIWTTRSGYRRWESARCLSIVVLCHPAWVWDTHNCDVRLFQFHAEVYFDQEQQGYMLVDQGSQNGTVINGNRILQVSVSSEFSEWPMKARTQQSWLISCSLKPSVNHTRWCTATRWRWERLFCPSTSTRGPIPVMAVSRVRWWLTSASTRQRRSQVRQWAEQRPDQRTLRENYCWMEVLLWIFSQRGRSL